MSSSLPFISASGVWAGLSLYATGVTDRSFALNMDPLPGRDWDWRRALVLNQTANLAWIVSTIIGGYSGQFIPAGAFGIDYALPACSFACWSFRSGRLYVLVAVSLGIAGPLPSPCSFPAMPIL